MCEIFSKYSFSGVVVGGTGGMLEAAKGWYGKACRQRAWGWRSGIGWKERKSIKMGLEPRKNSVVMNQLDERVKILKFWLDYQRYV